MNKKRQVFSSIIFSCMAVQAPAQEMQTVFLPDNANTKYADISAIHWDHGAESCEASEFDLIQVQQINPNSYILRQNKCVTFEAPFIYVLVGEGTVLVVDTGANEAADESPMFQAVQDILAEHENGGEKEILVVHSHSHGDHAAGDDQFLGQAKVELVSTDHDVMTEQLSLTNWPNDTSEIDLGNRKITIIPIPGHQEQSIAIYDHQTSWLLTGDTFYPGLIRVKNWDEFKESIQRLLSFAKDNPVSMILGAHIEMNQATNSIYKIGTRHQPNEPPLNLSIKHLEEVNEALKKTTKPQKLTFDFMVIKPLSRFEKMLSNMLSAN